MRNAIAAGILACALILGGCGGEQESTPEPRPEESVVEPEATPAPEDEPEAPAEQSRLDPLVLVNKTHALPDGWEERLELVEEGNSKGETVSVDRIAYDAFKGLQAEMAERGIQIELNSGYRSIATQQQIVDEFTADYGEDYVREFVATPGYSEHHTGLAFDVFLTIDGYMVLTNDEIYAAQDTWDVIHEALHRHGLILRYLDGREDITGYTYEPWHFRYVGEGPATEIWERGITLEEYLGELD